SWSTARWPPKAGAASCSAGKSSSTCTSGDDRAAAEMGRQSVVTATRAGGRGRHALQAASGLAVLALAVAACGGSGGSGGSSTGGGQSASPATVPGGHLSGSVHLTVLG